MRDFRDQQNLAEEKPINWGCAVELVENHWQAGVQSRPTKVSSVVDRVLIIAYRKRKKESQRQFWARFGVTQSRGSRFESGAEIPAPVSILLGLYFTKTVTDTDLGRAERALHGDWPGEAASELTSLDQSGPIASQ